MSTQDEREETRTILVTGISSGIGAAVGRRLLVAGHRVIGVARHPDRFTAPLGCGAHYIPLIADLADLNTWPVALDVLGAGGFGLPDGAVFAAGSGRFGSLEEFSYRQIHALIGLDLTAQIVGVRWLLPHLKRAGRGDLILIGSEAGLSGGRRGAVYAAAKTGLQGFVRALRLEIARSGVRITIINPGMVETPFFDAQSFAPGEGDDEHLVAEDVAAAVMLALEARSGAVVDEINLSPQKTVLRFRKKDEQH